MKLNANQIDNYHEEGFLLLPGVFTTNETDNLKKEIQMLAYTDDPRRILEKDGSLRSFFAPHLTNNLYAQVVEDRRLTGPARALLGTDIYIHQTKINAKQALKGDSWEWHQDYIYWKKEDGMPGPEVLTAMLFLDPVNEFNSPLFLIPGSHIVTDVDESENPLTEHEDNKWFDHYQQSTTYMTALTANLKYTLKKNTIAEWAEKKGLFSAKGPAGTLLFFHGNVFHASANNLSPWDRYTFLITYNSINNTLLPKANPRPYFLSNPDFKPLP